MQRRPFPAPPRSIAWVALLLAAGAANAASTPQETAAAHPGAGVVSKPQTADAPALTASAPSTAASAAPPPVAAMAVLEPRSNTNVSGKAAFVQHDGVVEVQAVVTGLTPHTVHGFHVHDKGDCTAPDASSAGEHFAPRGQPHGPQDGPHHAGDMPSLTADGTGMATLNFRLQDVTVSPGPYSLIGKAVVVHDKPDDFKTQPSGNSGARVACGVVQTDSMPAPPAK